MTKYMNVEYINEIMAVDKKTNNEAPSFDCRKHKIYFETRYGLKLY